jgi:hypothetical protein
VRATQLIVGQRGDLGLQRIDLRDHGSVFLEFPVVERAEDLAGDGAKGKHDS